MKEVVSALLQAGIAGFAYLQCPTIKSADDATAPENAKEGGK